ncbi:MAG: hypothetical protein ABIF08_03535 [Nanoarchaeota archaeon]
MEYAITRKQINTENVRDLHSDVYGDFRLLHGSVKNLRGDVTCIYGNADKVTEKFDVTDKYGGVDFFPRRKPVSY